MSEAKKQVSPLMLGLAVGLILASLSIILFYFVSRYKTEKIFEVEPFQPIAQTEVEQEMKEVWPPERLHIDAEKYRTSKLAIGDMPLSYAYLFEDPDSAYAKTIRDLSSMVTEDNLLVINFKPAELRGRSPDMILGAACITIQDVDALRHYHNQILASDNGLTRAEITEIVKGMEIDYDIFLTCFNDESKTAELFAEWNPEDLQIADFANKFWADGKPYDGMFDYCGQYVEFSEPEDIRNCLQTYLSKIGVYGSFQRFIAQEQTEAIIDLEGVTKLDSDNGSHAIFFLRDRDSITYSIYAVSPDKTRQELANIKIMGGVSPSIRYNDSAVFVLFANSLKLFKLTPSDSKVTSHNLPEVLFSRDDERILSFIVRGRQALFLACNMEYIPGDCQLRQLDLDTKEVSSVDVDRELVLYEGMWIESWDSNNQSAIMKTHGGDAGIFYASEFRIDLTNGLITDLHLFRPANYHCARVDEVTEYCDAAAIQTIKDYEKWLENYKLETRGACGSDLMEYIDNDRGAYLGCQ